MASAFHSTIVLACVAVVVAGSAFACSSAENSLVFIGGGEGDAGTGAILATEDAGADGETSDSDHPALCIATACPAPYASCRTFNGAVPEYPCETNLDDDPDHCGACGIACTRGSKAFHFERACVKGECRPFCKADYADCNGIQEDGCESVPKTDAENCGICGNKCPAGVACIDGKCGCPAGMTDCNGTCVDLARDDVNCGACGSACIDQQPADAGAVPDHMFYGCRAGACTELHCFRDSNEFWADCNGKSDDGCEVDLKQPNAEHCGKCGNTCSAKQECFSTWDTGLDCQCKGTKVFCPATASAAPVCADFETDPLNCGSCGYACPVFDHADAICAQGRCSVTCQPGRADCNGRESDGCEVDLAKDPRHCGACGSSCDMTKGQPCVGGRCVTKDCDAGVVQ